jgi:hypothetical protein
MKGQRATAPTHRPSYDYAGALKFVFDDPAWVRKILIGTLFTLLSVIFVGSIWVSGYVMAIIRRTMRREQRPLPEWTNQGELFRDGLRATLIGLIYALPLIVLAVLIASAVGGVATFLGKSFSTPGDFDTVLFLLVLTGNLLFSLAVLAVMFYLPAAFLRFVILDEVRAAFDFRKNIAFIRRNLRSYIRAHVVFFVASFVAQFGLIVLCIGFFPAAFWSICVFGYAMGKLAIEAEADISHRSSVISKQ